MTWISYFVSPVVQLANKFSIFLRLMIKKTKGLSQYTDRSVFFIIVLTHCLSQTLSQNESENMNRNTKLTAEHQNNQHSVTWQSCITAQTKKIKSPDPIMYFLQRHHWEHPEQLYHCVYGTIFCHKNLQCTVGAAMKIIDVPLLSLLDIYNTCLTRKATRTAGVPTHLTVSSVCCCWRGDCRVSRPKSTSPTTVSSTRHSKCSTPSLLWPHSPLCHHCPPPLTLGHELCP